MSMGCFVKYLYFREIVELYVVLNLGHFLPVHFHLENISPRHFHKYKSNYSNVTIIKKVG